MNKVRLGQSRLHSSVQACKLIVALLLATSAHGAEQAALAAAPGEDLYNRTCASCHANPEAQSRAPNTQALMNLPAERIYTQMTLGVMAVPAQALTEADKRAIAEYLGGRPLDLNRSGAAETMPNRCPSNPPLGDPNAGAAWNGWSTDTANTRFASAKTAGLTATQTSKLKLKWAFGFPAGTSSYGQPTIVSGRVFVGSDNGYFYSLNAKTGCVYWSYQAKVGVRAAPIVGAVQGQGKTQGETQGETQGQTKYAVYFGDLRANVYALDAATGRELWTARADDHPLTRIVGGLALHQGRLYAPLSALEEVVAPMPTYECCTFRGGVTAFDAEKGTRIWRASIIADDLKRTKKNQAGTQLWGPAGGAVWNTPTIDVQRGLLYVGTGDAYTEPAAATTDAVVALDMQTGKIRWSFQTLANDAWMLGCPSKTPNENCPKNLGPDHDVGASPILVKLANGKSMVLVTPKSGTVFAVDPDRNGALLWKLPLTDKVAATNGFIAHGGATDGRNLYLGLEDGTTVAIDLASGKKLWTTRVQSLDDLGAPDPAFNEPRSKAGLRFGQSAPATGIPGVVFTPAWNGLIHALSSDNGKVLWTFNTAQEFKTVNGVAARGGSMGGPGVTVADGMMYVSSGYAMFGGGLPGNVLLAFAVE